MTATAGAAEAAVELDLPAGASTVTIESGADLSPVRVPVSSVPGVR